MSNLVPIEYNSGELPGRNALAKDQSLPPKAFPSCIRSSRFDFCLVNNKKLLLASLRCDLLGSGVIKDAIGSEWFAKKLAFTKLDALGREIIHARKQNFAISRTKVKRFVHAFVLAAYKIFSPAKSSRFTFGSKMSEMVSSLSCVDFESFLACKPAESWMRSEAAGVI